MHWRACVGKVKPRTESRPARDNSNKVTPTHGETVSVENGMHGVGGDRMAGSWSVMNQGSGPGKGTEFMTDKRTEEPYPGADRAFVVAKKRRNGRGAKGGRKVEA